MNLEAAELLELIQWKDDSTVEREVGTEEFQARLAEECADILLYLLLICRAAGIDLAEAAEMKIKRNSEKYPLEKAYGSTKKYTSRPRRRRASRSSPIGRRSIWTRSSSCS